MLEAVVLGLIQGVAEWLPISSEGLVVAVKNLFFNSDASLESLIRLAIFLHLGTFLSALVYFRKDVYSLLKTFFKFKTASEENKKVLLFLIISTVISGVIGIILLKLIDRFENVFNLGSQFINILIALMLLITAFLQLKKKDIGLKNYTDIKTQDSVLLGTVQGLAVIPGLSRSGLTVATLLLRKFDESVSLKLSFLMSLPIVLAGNIFLNLKTLSNFSFYSFISLATAFLAGILTIHILLKLAKKINFGYFALAFAVLIILGTFI